MQRSWLTTSWAKKNKDSVCHVTLPDKTLTAIRLLRFHLHRKPCSTILGCQAVIIVDSLIFMEIAVYSGSFNPLHIGHLAIMRRLADLYDRVLLVVSPKNPLKDSATAIDAQARLDAARAAIERHPELGGKVVVSDIEFRLPSPNYTINTLDALKKENPSDNFTLTTSSDSLTCR